MNVIAVQHDIAWENRRENYDRVNALLKDTCVSAGSLVVLPETFAVGFTMDAAAAEEPGGETEAFLSSLARDHEACVVGGTLTRHGGGKPRNEAVAFGPDGELLARYAKMHPFSFANETDHREPGDAVVTFEWGGMVVAPHVCYDLRFPELFRETVKLGAQVFAVIANWPAPRADHWTTLLKARAIENQAYVVGVNRCGRDAENEYAGGSAVYGPRGELLVDAGEGEGVAAAELDREELVSYRASFPALDDMRF
jgi:predicted amidohydrolase